eukprot:TRINITY_DN3033_c0_g2_i1.p1 TRINITY_DN3033_c0_g2~~TRINITY_DN3033_c0_g2_i1.p1  ORF type:complete len:417 (-),score=63.80 TRINITY_DN3033_c0_g2_i1:58-1308(-)
MSFVQKKNFQWKQKPRKQQNFKTTLTDQSQNYNGKKKPDSGGLYFVDKQTISQQTSVLKHLATSMGKNLISGKSVVNISLPVIVFDTESFLERLAAQFSYAPIYLENAGKEARAMNQFLNVVAFNVTSLHLGMGQNKPFNPILGETFQGKIDGNLIYLEQISHHPPISSLLYFGKEVKINATLEVCVNLYPNSAAAKIKGFYKAKFEKTQQEIWFTKPQFKVKNMLMGERFINAENKVIHINLKEQLYCEILFHPEKKSLLKGLFQKSKHPKDYYSGKLYRTTQAFIDKFKKLATINNNYDQLLTLFNPKTDAQKEIANLTGIWHQTLYVNDQLIWKLDNNKPYELVRQKNPLPSDGIYRLDSITWKSKEKKEAQQMKEFLENIQRNDRKLRADYEKIQMSLSKQAAKQQKISQKS